MAKKEVDLHIGYKNLKNSCMLEFAELEMLEFRML